MHFFGVLIVFCYFWFFSKTYQILGQQLGSNRCLLFTMLTKQNFINVLHGKLVKKTKGLSGLLSDSLIQGLRFLKENGLIILGDLPLL
jgi:hypothetical protein